MGQQRWAVSGQREVPSKYLKSRIKTRHGMGGANPPGRGQLAGVVFNLKKSANHADGSHAGNEGEG